MNTPKLLTQAEAPSIYMYITLWYLYWHTVPLLFVSGLSPYRCYLCPGFHRTAVICVRAFTVLLLYVSGLSPYCCYMCPGFHRTAVICVRAFTVLLLYVSGLSPYCCYMCPGLHRTAVICVRAFTVPLFYSSLNYTHTGLHMELSIYPSNTISKSTHNIKTRCPLSYQPSMIINP